MKANRYEKHELQNSNSRLKMLSLVILIATSDFGPREASVCEMFFVDTCHRVLNISTGEGQNLKKNVFLVK
jgi:hypothetical protein